MRTLLQDLRYGFRMLVKNPALLCCRVTLALGIGAITAIFSVVNGVLLRPLPYPDADRLVYLQAVNPAQGIKASKYLTAGFADWKNQSQSFEG